MGSFRRRVIAALCLFGTPAAADICSDARPNWDGGPVSAWQEMIWLLSSPAALVMLIITAFVIRFRSQWGGLACFVGWAMLGSYLSFPDINDFRKQGLIEGCMGSPTLFLGLVTAICVGMILYTAPPLGRDSKGKE